MMRGRVLAFAIWLACSIVACSDTVQPLTQIVVVVDSDLNVPNELDALQLEISGAMKASKAMADLTDDPLPRSLGLVHAGGELGPITVAVSGLVKGSVVVERAASVSFQLDKSLLLRMPLLRSCVAADACDSGWTCDAGSCVSDKVAKLADWNGQIKPFVSDPMAGAGSGTGGASGAAAGGNDGHGGAGGRSGSGGSGGTNRPPTCTITSPKNNDTFLQNASVVLSGSCSDPEAGTLQSGLRWDSDRDGMLGTTNKVTRTNLSTGTHLVTLCATDPADASLKGCASVTFSVSALPAVTASITSVTQGATTASPFDNAEPISLMGTGAGIAPIGLRWVDSVAGEIGTGNNATLAPLVGRHWLTLTATDARSESASATRSFLVLEQGKSQLIVPFTAVNQQLVADGSSHVDVLSSASIVVYAAVTGTGKLYHFDPTEDPAAAAPTQAEAVAGAQIRDVYLPTTGSSAYVALSAGYQSCAYAAGTGIDIGSCVTTQGGKLPSDETTAAIRLKAANAVDYLLIGTNKGLFVGNQTDSSKDASYLSDVAVTDVASDDSAAWITTVEGLYSYDLTANDALNGAPQLVTIDAVGVGSNLRAAAIGTGGVLWLGGPLGVARFIPATGEWAGWRAAASGGGAPSLANDDVRAIAVAKAVNIGGVVRDVIWIATAAGVSRFDPTIPSFTTFTTLDGLPHNSVHSVLVLSNGDKVFGTDAGLALYKGP